MHAHAHAWHTCRHHLIRADGDSNQIIKGTDFREIWEICRNAIWKLWRNAVVPVILHLILPKPEQIQHCFPLCLASRQQQKKSQVT